MRAVHPGRAAGGSRVADRRQGQASDASPVPAGVVAQPLGPSPHESAAALFRPVPDLGGGRSGPSSSRYRHDHTHPRHEAGDTADLDLIYAGTFRPGIRRAKSDSRHVPSRAWRSRPHSAVDDARASARDDPQQGEPGGTCPRGRRDSGRPGGPKPHVCPEPADCRAPAHRGQAAARCPTAEAGVRWRATGAPVGSLRLRQDEPARAVGHHDGHAGVSGHVVCTWFGSV